MEPVGGSAPRRSHEWLIGLDGTGLNGFGSRHGFEPDPTLVLGEAAPDAEGLTDLEGVVEAGGADRAVLADGLGQLLATRPLHAGLVMKGWIEDRRSFATTASGGTLPRSIVAAPMDGHS